MAKQALFAVEDNEFVAVVSGCTEVAVVHGHPRQHAVRNAAVSEGGKRVLRDGEDKRDFAAFGW